MSGIGSVAMQSIAETPIKHAASVTAISGSALVETTSPYWGWLANGTVVMGFLLTASLFVHTLLKIRKQIRGE